MARANNLSGLDTNARRKTSNRAFEDMKTRKVDVAKIHTQEIPEKRTEGKARHAEKISLIEAPTFRARLTIRERKMRPVRTGVSIADE